MQSLRVSVKRCVILDLCACQKPRISPNDASQTITSHTRLTNTDSPRKLMPVTGPSSRIRDSSVQVRRSQTRTARSSGLPLHTVSPTRSKQLTIDLLLSCASHSLRSPNVCGETHSIHTRE